MPGGAARQKRRAGSQFYDNATRIPYQLGGEHDFGAGGATYYVQPPKGANMGQVHDIQVDVKETFNAVTTAGFVRVGNTADADKYAELDMGTAAINTVYGSYDVDIFASGKTGLIDMTRDGAAGAAITQVEIEYVAPTGGTPAGKGSVTVTISWW
jgi:hypothetical protein